jgi:cytochrome c oxidase subunit 1
MLNTALAHFHFWPSLLAINCVFMPMFLQGMAGVHRRWADGGATYEGIIRPVLYWNDKMSIAAFALGLAQLPFIFNFIWSFWKGKKVPNDNPWDSTTVEWDTPTPPRHGNFTKPITVYRGPYEYSVPGADKDYSPQSEAPKTEKATAFPTVAPVGVAHAH